MEAPTTAVARCEIENERQLKTEILAFMAAATATSPRISKALEALQDFEGASKGLSCMAITVKIAVNFIAFIALSKLAAVEEQNVLDFAIISPLVILATDFASYAFDSIIVKVTKAAMASLIIIELEAVIEATVIQNSR